MRINLLMSNWVHLLAVTRLAAAHNKHSGLRLWPLQEAFASDELHRFTKDYVQVLLQLQSQGGLHA